MKARLALLAAAVACALPAAAQDTTLAAVAVATEKPHIAVVNGRKVGVEEFDRALGAVVRQKFYHRAPPEGQIDQVRREVADSLVDRALLLAEADRRAVPVDQDAIRETLDGYEKRYGASPNWKATRELALPELTRELRQQQLLAKLEAQVRDVPQPSAADARAFFEANPAIFTEPERTHVSVILLKVDPSAPKPVRDKAREEGRELRERLARGADFAETAKIHSADASAAKGGDLGYLHRGMLGEALHQEIDKLEAGGMSPSVDVLEGVAVFRLHERVKPQLRGFDAAQVRAADLLKREHADAAWKSFLAGLRRGAVIETDATLYPKPAAPEGDAATKDQTWAVTDKTRAR